MLECRKCGANCDPGDLVNLVCEDCREEEYQPKMRAVYTRQRKAYEAVERGEEQYEHIV